MYKYNIMAISHYLKNDLKYKHSRTYHIYICIYGTVHVYVRTNGTMVHVYRVHTFSRNSQNLSGQVFTASCKLVVAHGKTLAIGGVALMTVTKLRPATWPGEQFGCGWGCLLPERVALERARKGDNSLHDRCIGLLPWQYGNTIAPW